MIQIQREDWAGLEEAWTALVRQAKQPAGPFTAPQFMSAWWDVFGADTELELLSVRDDGDLIGVLPLMRRNGGICFIGNPEVSDYMDLLAQRGREEDVVAALLAHLDASGVSDAELRGLAAGSETLTHLPALAQARNWTVHQEQEAVCPVLPLAANWDAYLAGLKKKYRHEVRRKLRNLLDGGAAVDLETAEDPDDVMERLPTFLRLMTDSRGDKAMFMTEQMATFFRCLVSRLAPAGFLRLYFLVLDGKCAAAVLCLLHDGTVMLYNSGYDPGYRDLAVGIASKVFVVRDCIERGLSTLNFLRGEEDYKFQLGAQPTPVTRLVLTR